jgi:hypothetical protein
MQKATSRFRHADGNKQISSGALTHDFRASLWLRSFRQADGPELGESKECADANASRVTGINIAGHVVGDGADDFLDADAGEGLLVTLKHVLPAWHY